MHGSIVLPRCCRFGIRDKKEGRLPQTSFLATQILRAASRQRLSDAGKTIPFTTATIPRLAPIALYTKKAYSSAIAVTSTLAQSHSFPSVMVFRTPHLVTVIFTSNPSMPVVLQRQH